MSIDTRVAGDPAAVRAAGRWLRDRFATAVTRTVDEVHGARRDSEAAWSGGSAEAFRNRTLTASAGADLIGEDAIGVARSLERYADDLDTALAGMQRARQIATDGGLAVRDGIIENPGPGLSVPMLPAGSSPEQAQAHGVAMEQADAQQWRIAVYTAAAQEVEQVRARARFAVETGRAFWGEVTGKWHLNAAAFTNGVITGSAVQHRKMLTAHADGLTKYANKLRVDYLHSSGGSPRARALTQAEFAARNGADDALRRAGGVASTVARASSLANPVIVAAGIGYDISQGKPPGKAITSGVAAGLAATAVGTYGTSALIALGVSGPVGWGALAAVGVGIGVGLLVDWGYDSLPAGVRSAIDDGLTAVGEGIADGASDAWEAVIG